MPDLGFNFKLSKQYLILLFLLWVLTTGIILSVPLILPLKLFILGILFIYIGSIMWRYVFLLSRHSIMGIRRCDEGDWYVQTKGRIYKAALCGDSTLTTFVSILRFRIQGQFWPKSSIVFRDSLGEDQYRHLLVLLKIT